MPVSLHPINGLPYGTLKRAPAPSFAHALLLDQMGDSKCWQVMDLYGSLQAACVDDAEVEDWPIVYTPIDDEEWRAQTYHFTPPLTAADGGDPARDHNYEKHHIDLQVDWLARHEPHGHVTPNDSGQVTQCGGLSGSCGVCRREAEILAHQQSLSHD